VKKKPTDQQVGFLRALIESMVTAIVEHEDQVVVVCADTPARVTFSVRVHHDDVGLVLGPRGATADAIRRVVWTSAKKTSKRVDVDFV